MLPLITVIVPVYNGQDYLENCIESIEAQTYPNLELLVINDGSTDGTGEVCTRLAGKYENIHIINLLDEGVSTARNAGLDAAKGTFVTFVDADDRLRPKTLEVLYTSLMETGCDISGCTFSSFYKEEEWTALLNEKYRIKRAVKFDAKTYLKEQILKGNSRCWSKLYRRAAIGKIRFQRDLSIGEDMLFLVNLLPFIRGVAETDYPGYGYYRNPGGAMNRPFTERYMDQIRCWELAREVIREHFTGSRAEAADTEAQMAALVMTGIMLTVGKLAYLSFSERIKKEEYTKICHEKLKQELETMGAREKLPDGYGIKTMLFRYWPHGYLMAYHFHQYVLVGEIV